MALFKEFYVCSKCHMAISGDEKDYFVCPECGKPLCQKSELEENDSNYCTNCGACLKSEKREAIVQVRKEGKENAETF